MFETRFDCVKYIREMSIDLVDLKLVDLMGRWRHLSVPARKISEIVIEEGFGFDASNYGFLSVEKSDMILKPDLETAFEEEWDGVRVLSLICNAHTTEKGEPRFLQDPRYIAQKAEEYLEETGVADEIKILPEFEFYVFNEVNFNSEPFASYFNIKSTAMGWDAGFESSGYGNRPNMGYHATPPGDTLFTFRNSLVRKLEESGVPVKYHHHEVGAPGQVEVEVEFDNLTRMADHTLLLKYLAHNIAFKSGKTATFMPKPIENEPGSGMHVHFKLYKKGRNIFADPDGYSGLSETALHFIGGILTHSKGLLAFTNPSTNSYKRLVPGYEAPVSIAYATANRSAAIRIPGYARLEDDKRFEYRTPDASCNPYLAFTALLLAGIDGVKKKINPQKAGFGPYDVNFFELSCEERKKIKQLPHSLADALKELEEDHEYLVESGVFPRELIKHWINLKREREIIPVQKKPHPYEFVLYYDV
ncbi:MAG: type I glutamate--ammonia ligase [Candidatus Eremiobacteraeota bacterium]|nr:type I glutamate--ammonia ligase [Candidatus Eremiobacteraeota bacterium]